MRNYYSASFTASFTALAIALFVTTTFAIPLVAQGTRADYKRAASLRERTRNKVLHKRVQANWLADGQRFWYRVQIAPQQHEFVIVDAQTKKRQPAFDHDKLAAELALQLSKKIEATRLPFHTLLFNEEETLNNKQLVVEFAVAGQRFAWDTQNSKLAATSSSNQNETTVTMLAAPRRSPNNSRVLSSIHFANRLDETVEAFWSDYTGKLVSYGKISAGDTFRQSTYSGHIWVIKNQTGEILGVLQARDETGLAIIDDHLKAVTVKIATENEAKQKKANRSRSSHVSPDGRWQASIEANNVFIQNLETEERLQLSTDGTKQDTYLRRFHWSPDSTKLVTLQERAGQQRQVQFIESSPQDQLQPKLHTFYYDKPGDKLPEPRVRLFDINTRKPIDIDDALTPNAWSIQKLRWQADSSRFTFLYNQRGHQLLRLFAIDATTGKSTVIVDEPCQTFFDYTNKLYSYFLSPPSKQEDAKGESNSTELIWMSERDGWNHLYLYDALAGEVKNQITQGEWVVRRVLRVDDDLRVVWFLASGVHADQDPYYLHLCRVNLDGTDMKILTTGNGTHSIEFSPTNQYFIDKYSRVDLPTVTELRDAQTGQLLCKLESDDWTELQKTDWQPPQQFVAKGRDGKTDIYGIIHRPTDFDPNSNKKYPVIEKIYAGPHSAFVPKRFADYHNAMELAELGFIVVQIDGMGTSHRSKKFHDVCWKNLGDSGFPDRILWMQAAAAQYPELDLTRVGIYGGSAGGQSALRAVLAYGDFYHAAVADCGCHDNRMDKVWWNEQWMGWPLGDHYAEQSNVTQAHRLQGKLLLTVGELDHNVDPASTMQVVKALIQASKNRQEKNREPRRHDAKKEKPAKRR